MKNKIFQIVFLLAIFSCSEKKEENVVTNQENPSIEVDSTTVNPTKEAVFKWQTELCLKEGTYDSKKYTASELQATYELWWRFSGYLSYDVTPSKEEDVANLSVEILDEKYNESVLVFKNLKIINEPYWIQLKKNKMRELTESYELKKIAIQAYTNPQILMKNRFTEHCREYALALSSSDDELLLKTWKNLIERQMEKNGSPDRVLEKYNQENASSDRLFFARKQLMTYGWWNCANHVVYHFEDDGTPQNEFEKLFSNIKSECDEP